MSKQYLFYLSDTGTVKIEAMMEYLLVNYSDLIIDDFRTPRSPFIRDGSVWVERVKVFAFEEGTPLSVVLLTWAAVFPIFNQRVPDSSAQNVLIALTEEVFQKPSKPMKNRCADRLHALKAEAR